MNLPTVAIIGRPNVGKSTLFNALIGKRRSIVSDISGTTRDNVVEKVTGEDFQYFLVDTAGLTSEKATDLEEKMQLQAQIAVENADVLLFVVDARAELTENDYMVVEKIRKSRVPVVFLANKVDDGDSTRVYDLASLGLGLPMAVSGKNYVNMWDLHDEIEKGIKKTAKFEPNIPVEEEIEDEMAAEDVKITKTPSKVPRIAFVGKPNAGKSTLLNHFLKKNEAIVSAESGTTRDSLNFMYESEEHGEFELIDTAGLRRKGRNARGIEYWSAVRTRQSMENADVCVLMLDATEGVTSQEQKLLGEIIESGKGVIIAINKMDIVKAQSNKTAEAPLNLPGIKMWGQEMEQIRKDFWYRLSGKLRFAPWVPIVFISAKNGNKTENILKNVINIQEERYKRVKTSELNRLVPEIAYGHVAPSVGTKTGKIKFLSQVDIAPPKFIFFVNNVGAFHWSYRRYCENYLRDTFGFFGTPMVVDFKDAMGEERRKKRKK